MKSKSRSKVQTARAESRKRISRPFVSATFAMTVDGKITTRNFGPVDFTSREDKLHLFRQRALADAVLLGHSTLKRDNVRLGLPDDFKAARKKRGQAPGPLRVIVSNEGRIDHQLKIFQSDPAKAGPILIFS
ncbi:MAG TPA: dihydrofolate reductase family protein, partial [Chthoniobacterales bacterium]|nr:dihydrofolate reductase family protein [Chthoniobacterales bacterium]